MTNLMYDFLQKSGEKKRRRRAGESESVRKEKQTEERGV
eukprot:CAMPEP_0201507348 /NCGR_PEP_ID=MMETSP0161_2-20130828/1035_1 /ASSEMBLY_ACC=CAM_ASM_000251 /TAXON_ID=180227 /ORGANISM="Neoparamoeba aestuarina, Strain SoJaBio B1-5/56/2" /LENGTH=38 /DNA_ID= /DNA_START= /DNA_END= /DNA_ORIENTATION=